MSRVECCIPISEMRWILLFMLLNSGPNMLIWGKKSLHYHSIKRQQKQQNQHTDISRLLDRLLENYVKKVQTLGLVQILHYNQLVSESDLHACYNSSFKVIVNYFRIFVMNTKFENYLFNNGIKIEFILK